MQIFKFGGASVKNPESLKNILPIISEAKELCVVVSAIDKTTNWLEKLVNLYYNNSSETFDVFYRIRDFHFNYVENACEGKSNEVKEHISIYFDQIFKCISHKNIISYDEIYDFLVSFGEMISTKIISEYLSLCGIANKFIDIREVIVTDTNHRDAKVLWQNSEQNAQKAFDTDDTLFVTQGFIGRSIDGKITTLGREGSDYTASALAYLLNADSVTIWKDVPGIMNADPAWCNFAQKLDVISYREAIELAFYGAKVIHPKTIKPIENKNIPLYVKSFINPKATGTVITKLDYKLQLVPVYIRKENQFLISVSPRDFSFIVEENLSKIFGLFAKYKAKVNITQNSAISFTASIDGDNRNIDALLNELKSEFVVRYNQNLELITIRYYTDEAVSKMTNNRKILMEQRSRTTARFLLEA